MTKFRYVVIGLLLGFSLSAMSEPIKCNIGQSDVDKLVCTTPELRQANYLLGLAYDEALHRVNVEEKSRLVNEQVQWENNNRNSCSDKDCLARSYASRILTITLNKEVVVKGISPTQAADRLADLKKDFQRMKIPLNIESCDAMAEVWQKIPSDPIWGTSYGAICNMPLTRAKVMACDDYMVGTFHALIGGVFSTFDLANFIATYCKPGG
jgi:uncharacterized protein